MAELTFLLVDDAAFIRDLVKKAVRAVYPGCHLLEAVNGRKAVTLLGSHHIDVVLCDWEMPEMSGLEVLQWMRADVRYSKTPFMMITSRGDRDHVVTAVEAGVSDYIGKPFSRDSFVSKLTRMVFKHLRVRPVADMPTSPLAGDRSGASVLMGATSSALKAPARPAAMDNPLLRAGKALAAEQGLAAARVPVRARGQACVRFSSGLEANVAIRDMNLQELSGVFRRQEQLPQLLEQVVVDIVDPDNDNVARVNAFVRLIQAQETHPDAENILIRVRYVDDDPDKLEALSRFIARVR